MILKPFTVIFLGGNFILNDPICFNDCMDFWAFAVLELRFMDFAGGSVVKNLPANAEDMVWTPGQEHPLVEEMANYFNIFACRIPWTEEPGRLQSMGSQSQTRLSEHTHMYTLKVHSVPVRRSHVFMLL